MSRTLVQKALVALRGQLHLTQQDLAVAMNVTTVTVARWETSRSPSALSLLELAAFASKSGAAEIGEIFRRAWWEEIPIDIVGSDEAALAELRASKDDPSLGALYRKVLETLNNGLVPLIDQALAGKRGQSDSSAKRARYLQRLQDAIEKELKP